MFKVEGNIPIPVRKSRTDKYPFACMSVGDSFALDEKQQKGVRSSSSIYGQRHGYKFTVRKTETGYRCWRIA